MSNRQQQSRVLPHLPKGIAMPEIQVSNHDDLRMPGQKALPSADWRNSDENSQNQQQLVPSSGSSSNRRASTARHGVPWTDRQSKLELDSSTEPPPMFSATPSKMAMYKPRESKSSQQIYRMDSGIDPVILLTNRLETWRLAIKNLVGLFKKIIAVELKTSKGLVHASGEIIVPFEKSNGQFLQMGSGGIQDVWSALRDYTMQHGIMHQESAGYIEKAVIPALRAIKNDIKTMTVSIQKDKALRSTDIFESRMQVDKLISRLDKVIESCNRSPQTANENTDPFLINLGIIHAVRELCDHENRLHDNILNLQKETGIFEEKIIENIRYVLEKLQEFRLKNKMEQPDFIGYVLETFNHVKPSLEWNDFVHRNQYSLILENSAYKTENMVEYPNQDSKYVRALKIGPLQTRAGVIKGWTEGVYLLTTAGFLHGYKTPDHFQTNPLRPSYTVFVPHYAVESNEDGSFELVGKKRSSMGFGTHYTFRANNPRENRDWFESFKRLTDQFRIVPLFDTTQNGFSSIQQNRDLPPLPASTLPLIEQPPPTPAKDPQLMNANQHHYTSAAGPSGTRQDDRDPVLEGEHDDVPRDYHANEKDGKTPAANSSLRSDHLPHPAAAVTNGAVDTNSRYSQSERALGQNQSNTLTDKPSTSASPIAAYHSNANEPAFASQQQQQQQAIQPPQSQLADLGEQQDFDKRPLHEQQGLPTSDVPQTTNKDSQVQGTRGFNTSSQYSKIDNHLDDNNSNSMNLAQQHLQGNEPYTLGNKQDKSVYSPGKNNHLQSSQKEESVAL